LKLEDLSQELLNNSHSEADSFCEVTEDVLNRYHSLNEKLNGASKLIAVGDEVAENLTKLAGPQVILQQIKVRTLEN